MRTFVNLRRILMKHKDLVRRLNKLEKKYDAQFKEVFEAIKQLMQPKQKPKRKIGFQATENK